MTVKADESPVTEADQAADRLICAALKGLLPGVPVVSEEGDGRDIAGHDRFWLVDPLDGTKSFIRGGKNFTVNIALIENKLPVLGVITVPAQNKAYWGMTGAGAFRRMEGGTPEKIATRALPHDGADVILSHSHISPETEVYLQQQVTVRGRTSAASSLKFCVLAEGEADLYPRFGTTMEWDTAAGHAILLAAGGRMTMPDGSAFLYGKPGFKNGDFLAWGR